MGYTLYLNGSSPSQAIAVVAIAQSLGLKVPYRKTKAIGYSGKTGALVVAEGKDSFIVGLEDIVSTFTGTKGDINVARWCNYVTKDLVPALDIVLEGVINGVTDQVDPNEVNLALSDELSSVVALRMLVR